MITSQKSLYKNIGLFLMMGILFFICPSYVFASWDTTTSLPINRYLSVAAAPGNGYIYIMNGYINTSASSSGTSDGRSFYALQNADGTLGAWSEASASIPANLMRAAAGVTTYNGYIYIAGGAINSPSWDGNIWYAKPEATGDITAWTQASTYIPSWIGSSPYVGAYYGYLYAGGGFNAFGTETTGDPQRSTRFYYAQLGSDGAPGTWTQTTGLPESTTDGQLVFYDERAYLISGFSSNVYYADISSGAIGSWTATTSLPSAVSSPSAHVIGGYIYVVQGGSTAFYYSKIQTDGTLGAWAAGDTLSAIVHPYNQGTYYNGYYYLIGDQSDTANLTRALYDEIVIPGNLFGPARIITNLTGYAHSFAADIDGDGDEDLLVGAISTGQIYWYENTDGNGTFGPQQFAASQAPSTTDRMTLFMSDIDGDGDLDIISGSVYNNMIYCYKNDGYGSFGSAISVATADGGSWRIFVAAADIDHDGDQDIVSAAYGSEIIAWHENTSGDGTSWTIHDITALSDFATDGAWTAQTADIDSDGNMDVLAVSNWDTNGLVWFENATGNGDSWTGHAIATSSDRSRFTDAADIDGDGDLDALYATWGDDIIAWYENTDGAGTFGPQQVIYTITGLGPQIVYAADFDNDGDMDAVSVGDASAQEFNWYENTSGDGSSWTVHTVDTGQQSTVCIGDLDGNSSPDLISYAKDTVVVAWYKNLGPSQTANSPPDVPTAISPANGSIFASGPVTLDAKAFSDPDSGDTLMESLWMVRRADSVYGRSDYDESFNFATTSGDLTSHEVTGLASGMKYFWKVGYTDSGSGITSWSGEYHFKIGTSVSDALPEVIAGTELADFKMVSFPCWLDDPSALSTFDISYDTRYYRIGHYIPSRNSGEYVEINDPDAVINPGEGMWVLARDGMDIVAEGIPVSTEYDIEVPLYYNSGNGNGWNQIGCPNAKDYYWAELQVIEYDAEGDILFGPAPISELDTDNEYIDVRIWEWADGAYASYAPDDNFIVKAYEGYWVRAKKANVRLNFPVSAQYSANRFSGNGNGLAMFFKGGKKWVNEWIVASPMSADVSDDSPPMPMGVFADSDTDRASSTGGCFIATAAYGSPLDRHVRMLREFRDDCLLSSGAGRLFVELYYRYSPPAAEYIAGHEGLRTAVRIGLLPVVGLSYLALYHPVMLAGLLILLAAVTGWMLFCLPKKNFRIISN